MNAMNLFMTTKWLIGIKEKKRKYFKLNHKEV